MNYIHSYADDAASRRWCRTCEIANTHEMQIKFFHKIFAKTVMNEQRSDVSLRTKIFKKVYYDTRTKYFVRLDIKRT